MKQIFKPSIVLTAVALIAAIALGSVCAHTADSSQMSGDSGYMVSENLALTASVDADGFGGKKLTDGDVSSVYRTSAPFGNTITLDFGAEKAFNTVIIKEQGLNAQAFTLSASSDGETYETIYSGDKIEYHRLCVVGEVSARYLRLTIDQTDGTVGLKEIEVYNESERPTDNFMMAGYLSGSWLDIASNPELTEDQRREQVLADMANYNLEGMTHLFYYCGCGFDAQGNVTLGSAENEQALSLVMDCLRTVAPDAKIGMVMGMNDPTLVNSAMGTNRDIFITNIIEKLNRFGFDGLDIDYEFPQSDEDFRIFDEFLVEVKRRMVAESNAGESAFLSCAFGTRDIEYSQQAIDAIDIVNCMAYDIMDQDGQHSSFWSCAVQPAVYLESMGFSREKINLGIPFYGTQTEALMEQYIYNALDHHDYFSNFYTVAGYGDGSPTEAYFNSPAMVRDKTAYALLSGYGGVMVWSFNCDIPYESDFSLWRAAFDALELYGKEA